jgi:hypothetical protein
MVSSPLRHRRTNPIGSQQEQCGEDRLGRPVVVGWIKVDFVGATDVPSTSRNVIGRGKSCTVGMRLFLVLPTSDGRILARWPQTQFVAIVVSSPQFT